MNPEMNAQIDRPGNDFISVGRGLPDAVPTARAVEGSMWQGLG
jgi:hypothetical protein